MTALAWVLIAAIPMAALGTVGAALRRGKPRPLQGWSTEQLKDRLERLSSAGDSAGGSAPGTAKERRAVEDELFRRGQWRREPRKGPSKRSAG